MEKVDLVYFVEHVARELDIACAVKAILVINTDVSVKIASITHGLENLLDAYQPNVVALPYCVALHEAGLDAIVRRWPKAKYINLAYEQVLGKAQKDLNSPKDEFARKHVVQHAWGDFFAQYLQDHHVPESHIVVNGNPSYSLYREPYKAFYENQRLELANKFGLDPHKRWVFIPENYGWAFFHDHMVRARIRRGFDPEQAYQYRDFARMALRASAQWWLSASDMDSIELIIRPRPAIPMKHFVETVCEMAKNDLEQVHFIKYGTVREWILASDVVISNFSTTLLEAAIAQKPVYMQIPIPFPEFLGAEWYPFVDELTTSESFKNAVSQRNLPDNWKALERWAINEMISRGDAISGLANMLISILNKEIYSPEAFDFGIRSNRFNLKLVKRTFRKHGWNLMQSSLAMLGIETQSQNWTLHEDDLVSTKAVDARVDRWVEILTPVKHT